MGTIPDNWTIRPSSDKFDFIETSNGLKIEVSPGVVAGTYTVSYNDEGCVATTSFTITNDCSSGDCDCNNISLNVNDLYFSWDEYGPSATQTIKIYDDDSCVSSFTARDFSANEFHITTNQSSKEIYVYPMDENESEDESKTAQVMINIILSDSKSCTKYVNVKQDKKDASTDCTDCDSLVEPQLTIITINKENPKWATALRINPNQCTVHFEYDRMSWLNNGFYAGWCTNDDNWNSGSHTTVNDTGNTTYEYLWVWGSSAISENRESYLEIYHDDDASPCFNFTVKQEGSSGDCDVERVNEFKASDRGEKTIGRLPSGKDECSWEITVASNVDWLEFYSLSQGGDIIGLLQPNPTTQYRNTEVTAKCISDDCDECKDIINTFTVSQQAGCSISGIYPSDSDDVAVVKEGTYTYGGKTIDRWILRNLDSPDEYFFPSDRLTRPIINVNPSGCDIDAVFVGGEWATPHLSSDETYLHMVVSKNEITQPRSGYLVIMYGSDPCYAIEINQNAASETCTSGSFMGNIIDGEPNHLTGVLIGIFTATCQTTLFSPIAQSGDIISGALAISNGIAEEDYYKYYITANVNNNCNASPRAQRVDINYDGVFVDSLAVQQNQAIEPTLSNTNFSRPNTGSELIYRSTIQSNCYTITGVTYPSLGFITAVTYDEEDNISGVKITTRAQPGFTGDIVIKAHILSGWGDTTYQEITVEYVII